MYERYYSTCHEMCRGGRGGGREAGREGLSESVEWLGVRGGVGWGGRWKIKAVKPKRDGGEWGDGNEERRERRTGGGEIISHRLAGAATGGVGGADPQLIIPSCLHLPTASAYEQWAEPQSSGGGEEEEDTGPRLALIGWLQTLAGSDDEGVLQCTSLDDMGFFFLSSC